MFLTYSAANHTSRAMHDGNPIERGSTQVFPGHIGVTV